MGIELISQFFIFVRVRNKNSKCVLCHMPLEVTKKNMKTYLDFSQVTTTYQAGSAEAV